MLREISTCAEPTIATAAALAGWIFLRNTQSSSSTSEKSSTAHSPIEPDDEVEAFTPAPMNRKLQLAFLLFFAIPQCALYWYTQDESQDRTELLQFLGSAFDIANWQRWTQSKSILLVTLALSIERIIYTIVWLFPTHFVYFTSTHVNIHPEASKLMGKTPLDVILFLFYFSKVFQYGSIFGWFFWTAPAPALETISSLRLLTGMQLVLVGQLLNVSIYRAIGKAGVYYGYKIGVPVPWCTGFPFNVFTMHPQYAGCIMTIIGGGILIFTSQHQHEGFAGVGLIASLYYMYMAIVEDIPAEHPLDQEGLDSPRGIKPDKEVKLTQLHNLEWSLPRERSFDTSGNLIAIMALPSFPYFVGMLYILQCFIVSIPSTWLLVLSVLARGQDRWKCIFVNAAIMASAAVLGICALTWIQKDVNIELNIPGLWLSYEQIVQHWPNTYAGVKDHGLMGLFAGFCLEIPLPVWVFGTKMEILLAPLLTACWLANFVSFAMIEICVLLIVECLIHAYRKSFVNFQSKRL